MTDSNEAFARVVIDAQLADQGWNTQDGPNPTLVSPAANSPETRTSSR